MTPSGDRALVLGSGGATGMAEQAAGVGVAGKLQRGLLTLLRIAIGWHFLYEGHAKFFSSTWTSAGYLEASRWIFGGAFQWMASHPAVIASRAASDKSAAYPC